jgi:hypothetical protein
MQPRIHGKAALVRLAPSLAAAAALTGCAIVGSQSPDPNTPPSGLLYHLPKAVLPVELVARGGALELRVQAPRQVVDPQQRYLLKHPVNVFSSDNVKIDYDTSGLLLSKLTIDSTDETLAVLKEVARASAIGRAEAAEAEGEEVLASGDFDPDVAFDIGGNAKLMSSLHLALQRHVGQWTAQCARTDIKDDKDKPAPENCAMAGKLAPKLARGESPLRISAVPMATLQKTTEKKPDALLADCSIGLCYRGQQPFVLTLEVGDLFSRSTVLMLPNLSPPIALALDRAPFVKTEHTVEFQANGTLKSVDTKRPSSALQLVSWPLDVYKAVLSATSELITLRIGAKDNEVKLAQKELDTAKELKRLADEMAAFNQGKKEAAGAGAGSRALLSIPLGRVKGSQMNGALPDMPAPKADCKPGDPCTAAAAAPTGGK